MAIDEARVESVVGQLAGFTTGGGSCLAMWLDDEFAVPPRRRAAETPCRDAVPWHMILEARP